VTLPRLTITVLGVEFLDINLAPDEQSDGPGDCTTTPIGFAASPGDQRWESAPDYG
jgi:hypothetical protein